MQDGYDIRAGVPSPEAFCRLRVAAGLSPRSPEGAAAGLPNTILGVTILRDGQLVGTGRVVGDGGCVFQVVDIAVHPDHQGRGLGKAIVGDLVRRLRTIAPSGAHVSLLADGKAWRLYAQFGFAPTAPDSVGMSFTMP